MRPRPLIVIEQDRATVVQLRRDGVTAIHGDAGNEFVLDRVGLADARILLITLPDALGTRQIVEAARKLAPDVEIVARVQSETERAHLARKSRVDGVLAELELAIEMTRHTMLRFGMSQIESQAVALDLRRGVHAPRDGTRVLEVRIEPSSKACGKALAELALGKGVLVFAIDRGGDLIVPDGQTRLEAGDLVLLVTSSELTEHVRGTL